jgi:hypothetical protein
LVGMSFSFSRHQNLPWIRPWLFPHSLLSSSYLIFYSLSYWHCVR